MAAPLTAEQLRTIRALPGNDACADTGMPYPDWCSVSFGTLISLETAGHHRGLGVHVSFVRSLTMDDFTEDQYERLIKGGNGKWKEYCDGIQDSTLKSRLHANQGDLRKKIDLLYNSAEAKVYRDSLQSPLSLLADLFSRAKSGGGAAAAVEGSSPAAAAPAAKAAVKLEDEPAPSYSDTYKTQGYPYASSNMFASTKSQLVLLAWGISGVWVALRLRGGDGDPRLCNALAAAAVALTVAIPILALNRFAATITRGLVNNRQDAFKSARNLLLERIISGRARRMARCDVYYPESQNGEKNARAGFIFYPGALVDRTAYAPIASQLSDLGVLVCVANLEPYRLIADMMNYKIRQEVMHMLNDALLKGDGTWTVDEWSIGGHSFGAHIATIAVTNEFHSTVKTMVLWGSASYPTRSFCPYRKTLRDLGDMKVLVLNGSEDAIAESWAFGANKLEEFVAKMPPAFDKGNEAAAAYTRVVTIEGGNHAGCAHYGPQTYPIPDGTRKITLDEQQSQMANLTAKFLLGEA